MDYLSRGDAPFGDDLWARIDAAVVASAKDMLVGRRFLPLYGPLGPGASAIKIDAPGKAEQLEEGLGLFTGRQYAQLPQLYEDFWLYWRDVADAERDGVPVDISAARTAAANLALREDEMVFYGVPALGVDGLANAKGAQSLKRGDWAKDENAFTDIAAGISALLAAGKVGRHTLVVSQDLYVQLQRIQPGTGLLESKRIEKLLDGRLFAATALKPKTALLLSAQSQYVDLALGQDIATAYTEAVDLNHHLRVLETALPRVKDPGAIVLFK